MSAWIADNWLSLILLLLLAALFAAVFLYMVRQRKQRRRAGPCSGGCDRCAHSDSCTERPPKP